MKQRYFFGGLVAAVVLAVGAGAPPRPEGVVEGEGLYLRYCSACHGREADGNGPVASQLRTRPPDLRELYLQYGRPLPIERLAQFIDGRLELDAHGTREMPVWGEQLGGDYTPGAEARVSDVIHRILDFLQSIQGQAST